MSWSGVVPSGTYSGSVQAEEQPSGKKTKYIVIEHQWEIQEYYKKGYEVVCPVHESHIVYESISGQFMGNQVSVTMPVSVQKTRFLMALNETAETLYGEKRDT